MYVQLDSANTCPFPPSSKLAPSFKIRKNVFSIRLGKVVGNKSLEKRYEHPPWYPSNYFGMVLGNNTVDCILPIS